MVDESLVAHLRRKCQDMAESIFRELLNYSVDNFDMRNPTANASCSPFMNVKCLIRLAVRCIPYGDASADGSCTSKLDPTNEMWRDFILELSLAQDKAVYRNVEDEEERSRLRKDIEQSFNRNVNDPDYARKLYLIENCIYGVDIQPIAVQISKLRFFISLVSEQKPTGDAASNFGIRPLPNLEAKFVAANTLIPLEKEQNIFGSIDALEKIKRQLSRYNHRLFIAKRNRDKKEIRRKISELRKQYSEELLSMGSIGPSSAALLAEWDMFDQNSAARFFDSEWMFDIADGFDVVIGNPPYVIVSSTDPLKVKYDNIYEVARGGKRNLFHLFFERSIRSLSEYGTLSFITPDTFLAVMTLLSSESFS